MTNIPEQEVICPFCQQRITHVRRVFVGDIFTCPCGKAIECREDENGEAVLAEAPDVFNRSLEQRKKN